MVVVEKYPELKSDQNFRDLQAQLEGTENRITVARNRYIAAVQDYNTTVRQFPSNLTAMVFGYAREAELHGAERSGDLEAAGGQVRRSREVLRRRQCEALRASCCWRLLLAAPRAPGSRARAEGRASPISPAR